MDLRQPKIQEILKQYVESKRPCAQIFDIGELLNKEIVTKIGVVMDFTSDYGVTSGMIDVKLLSELNPFDFSPDVWKQLQQPNVLYVCVMDKNTAAYEELDEILKYYNNYIKTRWYHEIQHHSYKLIKDNIFRINKQ